MDGIRQYLLEILFIIDCLINTLSPLHESLCPGCLSHKFPLTSKLRILSASLSTLHNKGSIPILDVKVGYSISTIKLVIIKLAVNKHKNYNKMSSQNKRYTKKINYMFKIPIGYMTDEVKKTQSEVITSYVQLRQSVTLKLDQQIIDSNIKQYQEKMANYANAITTALKTGPFEKKETETKKESKK